MVRGSSRNNLVFWLFARALFDDGFRRRLCMASCGWLSSRRRLRLFLVDATVVYIVVTAATGAARQPKNLRFGYENFAVFLAGSRIVFPP